MTDTTLIKVSELNRLRAELASGSFYKESDIDAMQDEIASLRAEVEKYREALDKLEQATRPFAAAVFNDNGDVTISTGHLRTSDWLRLDRTKWFTAPGEGGEG